jgi:hypothetical protein
MTKAMQNIDEKLSEIAGGDPAREHVLVCAKQFKTSWVELGRALYAVWKDKLYRNWGYGDFDAYTSKEIGIKKNTSMKLLKSYYFLEKEEPQFLSQYQQAAEQGDQARLPGLESIDLLRKAKEGKQLDTDDYQNLKEAVLKGKEDTEVKKELTSLIRQREELEPEEAWERKRGAVIRRFVGTLRSLSDELKSSKIVSAQLIKETEALLRKLESEIS